MIIIRVQGGLGNQMFQYALYYRLKNNSKIIVKLDISTYQHVNYHNGYELDRVFKSLNLEYADPEMVYDLADVKRDMLSRIRRKFFFRIKKKTHYKQRKPKRIYNEFFFKKNPIYLDGYWQSEKYFYENKKEISNEFQFIEPKDLQNKKAIDRIKNSESVSVHIRRGDYLGNSELGNICDIDYYKRAINLLEKKVKAPKFFFFSDDPDWVKIHFKNYGDNIVDWNKSEKSYIDMYLMSLCKHNIIANSSFSWWGAYLNQNPTKIVIAPNPWIRKYKLGQIEIIPEGWEQLEVKRSCKS